MSSQAGQTGVYGYTAYSASKFALRGLAETLHMEVNHLGIGVTISFPPDTQTPGFDEESKTSFFNLLKQTFNFILYVLPHLANFFNSKRIETFKKLIYTLIHFKLQNRK